MIWSSSLHDGEIADIASCSKRTVTRVRANMRAFGTPCSPKVTSRQRSHILPHVLETLLNRLLLKPDLYLDEMAEFIWDEYGLDVSVDSVRRSLKVHMQDDRQQILRLFTCAKLNRLTVLSILDQCFSGARDGNLHCW
jgi:hypothetical protein